MISNGKKKKGNPLLRFSFDIEEKEKRKHAQGKEGKVIKREHLFV
jgi:hypothetical protein